MLGKVPYKQTASGSAGAAKSKEASLHVGASVGAGAVVVNGSVSGGVVVHSAAPEPPQVDRRAVAETLQAMQALDGDQHLSVVAWMEREFGTQIVKGLSATAQRRLRRYVAAVLKAK